ncbi:hypothetical protein AB0G32_18380 [Streptomyces sp. NPDC023723]|uniref:hypothetical protein n=1 Tax=Streptomyces sp. NPDC023723 TaxID=3154323 RepID=UPI0033CAD8C5
MRSRGTKTGAITVAALLGGAVLAGCGADGTDGTPKARDGSASASASSSSPAAQEPGTAEVRAAYDKTAEAESARTTIDMELAAGGRTVTSEGKGAIDLAEGDSVMTITAQDTAIEQRVVDQVLYQQVPDQQASAGKPWISVDLAKVAAQQGLSTQQIGDPAQTAAFAKAITDQDVAEVGPEQVGGVDTTHYKVSVDVSRLPAGELLAGQLGPTLPMQVWLDDQGRLRRQQLDITVEAPASASATAQGSASPQQLRMSTVMTFSDFGTEVDAEAPPAGQVTDMTDQTLKGTQGQG